MVRFVEGVTDTRCLYQKNVHCNAYVLTGILAMEAKMRKRYVMQYSLTPFFLLFKPEWIKGIKYVSFSSTILLTKSHVKYGMVPHNLKL